MSRELFYMVSLWFSLRCPYLSQWFPCVFLVFSNGFMICFLYCRMFSLCFPMFSLSEPKLGFSGEGTFGAGLQVQG